MAEGPPAKEHKQQQANADTARQHDRGRAVPRAQHLFQVAFGMGQHPSPGAMHACRIAALEPQAVDTPQPVFSCLLASGPSVCWSHVQLPAAGARAEQGKEGALIPARVQAPPAELLSQLKHGAEVQSLDVLQQLSGGTLLATADCYGRGVLARLQLQHGGPAGVSGVQRLLPAGAISEGGWAGVCLDPQQPGATAAVRAFPRDVQLFDQGQHVRTLGLQLHPYAARYIPVVEGSAPQLLAVAESHMVSLWDARAGEQGGLVTRMQVQAAGSALYCLDWCTAQGGLLGAAGEERSLLLIDPRKWRPLSKWSSATRQAIHYLSFLNAEPHACAVSGLDHEVVCARWDKPASVARKFETAPEDAQPLPAGGPTPPASSGVSFRGDARWLGVTKAKEADVLACFAASGSVVYAALHAEEQPCVVSQP